MNKIVPVKGPGEWRLHVTDDGVTLVRPSARVYIPDEMIEPIARALKAALKEKNA